MNVHNYSTQFDKLLIESVLKNDFITANRSVIDKWLHSKSIEDIYASSIELHRCLVEHYMQGKIITGALNNIYKNWSAFEQNIGHVKSSICNKFYRDHIAHTIRTMLIMLYLAENYFSFDEELLDDLAITALFHDIAYPIQEKQELENAIGKAFSQTYLSISAKESNNLSIDPKSMSEFISILYDLLRRNLFDSNVESNVIKAIVYGVMINNHAMISAFELWLLLMPDVKNDKRMQKIILAIALHECDLFSEMNIAFVEINKLPCLYFLILADELQEWNRVVCEKDKYSVLMEKLDITNNFGTLNICGKYCIIPESPFAFTLQMIAKSKSLARLNGNSPIRIEFSDDRFMLKTENFFGIDLNADITQEINSITYKFISINIIESKDGLCLEYCYYKYSPDIVDIHFKNNEPLIQETLRISVPLNGMNIDLKEIKRIAIYSTEAFREIVICLTKLDDYVWPNKLGPYALNLSENSLKINIDGLVANVLKSVSCNYEVDMKSAEEETVKSGYVEFRSRSVKLDSMPYGSVMILYVQ
jgi:hypothetical protein